VLTAIGAQQAAVQIRWRKAAAIILTIWGVLYGPAVVWTAIQSGSPLGLATAGIFHSHFFGTNTLAQMEDARIINQVGLLAFLKNLPPRISVGMVAAFCAVAAASLRRGWQFKLLLGLVAGQSALVAILLPHDFRFLGGLQFAALVLGASVLLTSSPATFLKRHWCMVLLVTCLPWLALQAYYARPFVETTLGPISRDSFKRTYVAFTDDFRALDHILPPQAVLYVVNSRFPSYYSPRPVIFSLDDLRGRGPLYRFSVGGDPPTDQNLVCTETVYENSRAIAVVFRTPGREPILGSLRVERCNVRSSTEIGVQQRPLTPCATSVPE
jgi:hypothetical protein